MAKILFLQNLPFEYMGPMYLSAVLKEHGHQCSLIVASENKNYFAKIREINPDFIGFSTMTGPHNWVVKTATEIKKYFDKPVILGGTHPTFFPEIIYESSVDIICLGEGEETILELAEKYDKNEDIFHIKNLWIKKNGRIFKNELRPLVEDLDQLPFPDRTLYDDCKILRSVPAMKFLTGRGCPYRCSFCFNHKFNELYRGLGRIVRKRGIDNLIAEIKETKEEYDLKLIRFPDDTFTGNKQWLIEFLGRYKEKINLPFTGLARANELDEESVIGLKNSGCLNIYIGVETGNENLRNKILKKKLTNKQIINATGSLREYNVRFGTYNMFGLPGETLDLAFETIKFNHLLKPDYTINNIFQPYPKTELANVAAEQGLLNPNSDYLDTMNEGSILKLDNINQLVNLCRFAYLAIKFPIVVPFIKVLIKLPPNRLFKLVFELSSAPPMKSNLNLSWINLLKWGIKLRNLT